MITDKEILAPTMDSAAFSDSFDVDGRSAVIRIKSTEEDGALTEDDSFRLCHFYSETNTPPVKEEGSDILLGANRTQFEVLIRGSYVIEKILATTESVGAYRTYGNEEGV